MSAFSGLSGGPYPSHSAGPIYNLSDSFSWVKGNHTFKFGGLWEYSGENDNDEINVQACPTCTNNQNGQFLFSDNGGSLYAQAMWRPRPALQQRMPRSGSSILTRKSATAHIRFSEEDVGGVRARYVEGQTESDLTYGLRYTVIVPYHAVRRI